MESARATCHRASGCSSAGGVCACKDGPRKLEVRPYHAQAFGRVAREDAEQVGRNHLQERPLPASEAIAAEGLPLPTPAPPRIGAWRILASEVSCYTAQRRRAVV